MGNIQKNKLTKISIVMSNLRFKVVERAFHVKPVDISVPKERPSEYFAKYVFNREKMFKYLPTDVYKKLA